ncbi:putative cytochrome P450 oxidoreductase OrdA-like protein [Periconia macrospinosa]|uniref:Bifunctional cytochrome P450/NADPH--P450 reductase n=1 Tax=Periconia macrospinosa TaxID=97972 RepID=A0A2V1DLX8_9PLEO|nr:putative cytochrome P450 oxidoreductase OrdA-like protein [Periconia macrospinosa]
MASYWQHSAAGGLDQLRSAVCLGQIYKIAPGPGQPDRIYVRSVALLNDVCDESRFVKNPNTGGLYQVRNGTGDGLFTALDGEENWALAHRILMPVLGPMAIGDMFDDMYEVACQLVLKWARYDSPEGFDVSEEFTRLTLDTLALCTMDTRFNSFYSETPHPFVVAMGSFLQESGIRSIRPSLVTKYLYAKQTRAYFKNIATMRGVASEVIARRKSSTSRKQDLVDAMLNEQDPVTGKSLPEENIINNMITFLIAGHETTSGLLSFLLYELIKHPRVMEKAQAEVSSVLGGGPMTQDMIARLPYVTAIVRETLRLYPTAPAFAVQPKSTSPEDYPMYLGKEEYIVRQGDALVVLLADVHRDPSVYGDDAGEFRPERMLDEEFNKLPKHAWKPFGSGARRCIGRAFALQEAGIVVALLLQNFNLELSDPNYELSIKKALTIKPQNLRVHARMRDGLMPLTLQRRLLRSGDSPSIKLNSSSHSAPQAQCPFDISKIQPMVICYGSNTGSCRILAHTLGREAISHGFQAEIFPMDKVESRISSSSPIIIITASYDGKPPDNAGGFVSWLQSLTESPFSGVHHAVFGCGNRDWAESFQRIPKLVDETFTKLGSSTLVQRGLSDAADGNIANDFDLWVDEQLWPALEKHYQPTAAPNTKHGNEQIFKIFEDERTTGMLPDGGFATVEDTQVLTAAREPEKRHIALRLPNSTNYRAGDYLEIFPSNSDATVRQVMTRFGLTLDAKLTTPKGEHHSIYTYLRDRVELNRNATSKQVRVIYESLPESTAQKISSEFLHSNNKTILQILREFPDATLSLSDYLDMLPPISTRRYSISSSSLQHPGTCSLTYSVVSNKTTLENGTTHDFYGACTSYLASLRPGERLCVSVRPASLSFQFPQDPTVPIAMICAGSGLAPFMGFLQERAYHVSNKVDVGPAMLFIGCRHPDRDLLYSSTINELAASARTSLFYSFSAASKSSHTCKYVQDRIEREGKQLFEMVQLGDQSAKGSIYVCGSSKMLNGVAASLKRVYGEIAKVDSALAETWWGEFSRKGGRFATDIFD